MTRKVNSGSSFCPSCRYAYPPPAMRSTIRKAVKAACRRPHSEMFTRMGVVRALSRRSEARSDGRVVRENAHLLALAQPRRAGRDYLLTGLQPAHLNAITLEHP